MIFIFDKGDDSLNQQDNSISNCHNVFLNKDTGFLSAVGSDQPSGTLCIYDVTDPGNPTYADEYADDGCTYDVHCGVYQAPNSSFAGKQICLAYNEDSVTVIDVSNNNKILRKRECRL